MTIRSLLALTADRVSHLVRNALTWQRARGVGELQFLTRASYATLFIVPLLAGVWPSVRVLINNHNRLIAYATADLEATAVKLDRLAADLIERTQGLAVDQGALTNFARQVNELSSETRSALAALQRAGSLSPWLPQSFALAFFAALAVVIGHFIYQARAPAIVRKYSEIDYVRERRQSFRDQPYADEFENALKTVRLDIFDKYHRDSEVAAQSDDERNRTYYYPFVHLRDEWDFNFRRLAEGGEEAERVKTQYEGITLYLRRIYWFDMMSMEQNIIRIMENIPEENLKKYNIESIYENVFGHRYIGPISEETVTTKKLDVIGEAARIRYLRASGDGSGLISITFLAYGLGGAILLWILAKQCQAVLAAAGWVPA